MLTAGELSTMRSAVAAAMVTACSVNRDVFTADSSGGRAVTSTNATVTVCNIRPKQRQAFEGDIAGKVTGVQQWVISLPYNTDVLITDYLTIGTVNYQIISIDSERSWNVCVDCTCERLK